MNTFKHIALIATVSVFASCAKNEVVEPATPKASPDAATQNTGNTTTPLLDSDTPPASTNPTTVNPLLDSDTYPGPTAVLGNGATGVDASSTSSSDAPVTGKAPFAHNLEAQ